MSLVSLPQFEIFGAQIAFLGAPAMRGAAGLLFYDMFFVMQKKSIFVGILYPREDGLGEQILRFLCLRKSRWRKERVHNLGYPVLR